MTGSSKITTAASGPDVEATVRSIFETVFSRSFPPSPIHRLDVDDWDSLRHVELILVVEDEFDVRFDESEFGGLDSLAAIVQAVEDRRRE
jgi:acyl carrier protein